MRFHTASANSEQKIIWVKGVPMRWVVVFEDSPQMLAVREKHGKAHMTYLKAHQDEILLARGLRTAESSPYCGGLWVMSPMTKDRVVELVEADPYLIHGMRSYKILWWGKAFEEISVTL